MPLNNTNSKIIKQRPSKKKRLIKIFKKSILKNIIKINLSAIFYNQLVKTAISDISVYLTITVVFTLRN